MLYHFDTVIMRDPSLAAIIALVVWWIIEEIK
jgi:hypothetical protein